MFGSVSSRERLSSPAVGCRQEKRQAAERLIRFHAGLAAANSLNPVPGLDVGVDAGILTALHHSITRLYGLPTEPAQSPVCFLSILQPITWRLGPTLTGKVVGALLRQIGLECIGRETTKWLPVVGTAISATIGYQIVSRYGEKLLQECESATTETPELAQLPQAA